jgi:hypothetical protein
MVPLTLSVFGTPTPAEIAWAIAMGVAAALVTGPIRLVGRRVARVTDRYAFVVVPVAGLITGVLAFVFAQVTDRGASLVLFSGQDALPGLVTSSEQFTVGVLLMLMLCKGLAWAVSMGAFRGGPTFPAMFLGTAGGIAASHLPGLPLQVAVPVGMGAMMVAILRLPLSAIVIASLLCASAGAGVAPLVIVGVVVAYLVTLVIDAPRDTPSVGATTP